MVSTKVDMKVVLLGKEFGGKTSLVERFLNDRFLGDVMPYQNTIGAAYGARTLEVGNRKLTLGIWDTAGSERYEAMSRIYYRGAKAAVLCYDLTDASSFQRVNFWVGELKQHEENCKIYLCGTKHDLVEENPSRLRAIDEHNVKDYASEIDADVFETSSKSGYNIRELFQSIASKFIDELTPAQKDRSAVDLRSGMKKRGCCSR